MKNTIDLSARKRQNRVSRARVTRSTSMERVLNESRESLIRQASRRDDVDADARKALSALVIKSGEETQALYQNAVKTFEETSCKALEKEESAEKIKNLNSIAASFITCEVVEEPTYAQRLYGEKEKIVSRKGRNIIAQFNVKGMLDMLRNAMALRNTVCEFTPDIESFFGAVLSILKVLLQLNDFATVEFSKDTDQGKILEAILVKTNWGRDTVDLEKLSKSIAEKNANIKKEKVEEIILEVFEKKYNIIDVTNGEVRIVESISYSSFR